MRNTIIKIKTESGFEEKTGDTYASGLSVVTFRRKSYSVTHTESGYAIAHFTNKKRAEAFMRTIKDLTDWTVDYKTITEKIQNDKGFRDKVVYHKRNCR